MKKILMCLSFIFAICLFTATKASAYTLDSSGNLVSDNLFEYPNWNITLTSGQFKWSYISSEYMPNFENGKKYTIYAYMESKGNLGCQVQNMNYAACSGQNSNGSLRSYTFTYNGTIPALRFGSDNLDVNVENFKVKLMIIEGSTILPYETYGEVFYSQNNYDRNYAQGYQTASNDGKILGTFIPNLLGGIGSFFLILLNIDFLGFNLLSVLGILIAVLGVIIVIKLING